MVGYPSQLVVWNPLCLDPSNGMFDLESDWTAFLLLDCLGTPVGSLMVWTQLFLNPSDDVFGRLT